MKGDEEREKIDIRERRRKLEHNEKIERGKRELAGRMNECRGK